MKIVLASASPRRRELIKMITTDFTVIPADIEEIVPKGVPPMESAEYLAVKKALSVAGKLDSSLGDSLVIGCDTSVICGDKILGKPVDTDDAKRMIELLSGKTHYVVTGCCLCKAGKSSSFSQVTQVEFYPISQYEISEYIATGEPYDKAGAYGIQGKGSLFVKNIYGDYYNVVGLPVARISREIINFNTKMH